MLYTRVEILLCHNLSALATHVYIYAWS